MEKRMRRIFASGMRIKSQESVFDGQRCRRRSVHVVVDVVAARRGHRMTIGQFHFRRADGHPAAGTRRWRIANGRRLWLDGFLPARIRHQVTGFTYIPSTINL